MTPEQQVKEIIILMNPEDPGTQTDAVFLVKRYMLNMSNRVSDLTKSIALLEAKLNAEREVKTRIMNEKLESETRLKKEKADIVENGLKAGLTKPLPKKDKTL